jgi:hypothetical protein
MDSKKVLKVLATSRPYITIEDLLVHKEPVIRLKTEDEEGNIREDIVSFINYKVEVLKQRRSYDDSLANEVRDVLRKGSGGMFLWASLIIEDLLRTSIKDVKSKLKKIPRGLNELHTQLLNQLAPEIKSTARKVLMWVVTAPRPMHLDELAWACTVTHEHQSLSSIENSIISGFIQDVKLCGPILKYNIESGIVTLVHQSA